MASDGAAWSVRRQRKGALLTVTKPRWTLPKGETIELYLYFGERAFGHYRPVKARKVRGGSGLTFPLDDELLLAFRVMESVKVVRDGMDLTDWLELDGSSRAYARLGRCPAP